MALLCAAGVFYLAGLFLISPLAEAKIQQLCGGAVSVQSGRFTVLGAIRLKGLVVAADSESLKEAPLLQADGVDIRLNPWDLLKAGLTVQSVTVSDFLFTADYDVNQGWNLSRLAFGKIPSASVPQKKFPLIQMRHGAVRLRRLSQKTSQTITTFSVNGDIARKTGPNEYSFSLESDGRFGFEGSRLQGVLTIGSQDQQSRFTAQGDIRMPKVRVLDNAWNMENIRLECTFDSEVLSVQHLGFSMGPGRADFSGQVHLAGDGPMDLKVSTQGLSISDQFVPDTIVCSTPVQMLLDSGLSRFLGQYHVCGQGDINVAISGRLDDLSATQVNGVIQCLDISVKDEKFPYLISRIQGPIELTGRSLKLNQLRGRHGPVELLIEGTVDDFGPNAVIDLRTISDNMRLDEDLYRALPESMKKMWFAFTPEGVAGVDYHFHRNPDRQKDMTLLMDLKGASATYEYFAYPLKNLTGTIKIKTGQCEFKEVTARYDDGRLVVLNGQVSDLYAEKPSFEIHVRAEHIPVNEELIGAMPSEEAALFERLEIEAVMDLDLRVVPHPTQERFLDYTAKITLDGSRLLYEGFPLEMSDVHIAADVTEKETVLHHFQAQTEGGQVSLSGKLLPFGFESERPGFCLEMDLKGFDLNDAFWKAAGPDAEQKLAKLKVKGKVDAAGYLEINFPGPDCIGTDLVVDCNDNAVEWNGVLMGHADGRLFLQDQAVNFEKFQMRDIPLDSLPQDMMNDRVRTLYEWARPGGQARVLVHDGQMQIGSRGPSRLDMNTQVELSDVSLGGTDRISQLNGVINGHLAGNFKSPDWKVAADSYVSRFRYRDWAVTDLSGKVVYDPNTMQLSSPELAAVLYDGTLKGWFRLNFDPQVQTGYMFEVDCDKLNLQKLLEAKQPQDAQRLAQGLVSGTLGLEGDLNNLAEPRGRLEATIENMKMGRQSLPGKILTAVQLRRPEEYVFSQMKVKASVRGSELILDDVLMVGEPLIFRGNGRLDMQKQQIQLALTATNRLAAERESILDRLLRGIGSALWRVEVSGDMREPDIQAVYLSVLKPPISSL